jgi:hypothetical protein
MALSQTGSFDENLKEIRDLAESIDKILISSLNTYRIQVNEVSDLAKNYTIYKRIVSEVKQISTDISHVNDNILSITSRLGLETIRQSAIDKVRAKIKQNEQQLDSQALELQNKNTERQNRIQQLQANLQQAQAAGNIQLQQQQREAINAVNQEYYKTSDLITKGYIELQKQKNELDEIEKGLKQANSLSDAYIRKANILTNVFSRLSNIPIIGPLLRTKELADSAMEGNKALFSEFKTQVKNIFDSPIAKGFMAFALWSKIFGVIKNIAKAVLELDNSLTKVSNNLGISVNSTRELARGMFASGEASNTLKGLLDSSFLSMTNILKAMGGLQEGFGTSAAFSKEMVQSQILLTDQMGFANEEAIEMQKFQYLAGVNAKGFLDTVVKQVSSQEKQNRISLSYRKVILEVAKASAEITASYKNNPEFLAKAVAEAQRLGLTLEQTRKISDSLLNFETSIEGELKAELVIGKQLNFEKARALALDGKSSEAASDIISQMGGLNELTKLNVIQRRLLAESIGMTSEELVKAAQQEKIIKDIGAGSLEQLKERYNTLKMQGKVQEANALLAEIQRHENGEILAQDIAKASVNQRFEQSMLKLKEIFVDIAQGPIISMVEGITNLLKHTTLLKGILITLAGIATGLATALTLAAFAASVATGGLVLAGGVAGGLAVAGLFSGTTPDYEDQTKNVTPVRDAAISPMGEMLISTPKGEMIKTDKSDYVYATPVAPQDLTKQNNIQAENNVDISRTTASLFSNIKEGISKSFEDISKTIDSISNSINFDFDFSGVSKIAESLENIYSSTKVKLSYNFDTISKKIKESTSTLEGLDISLDYNSISEPFSNMFEKVKNKLNESFDITSNKVDSFSGTVNNMLAESIKNIESLYNTPDNFSVIGKNNLEITPKIPIEQKEKTKEIQYIEKNYVPVAGSENEQPLNRKVTEDENRGLSNNGEILSALKEIAGLLKTKGNIYMDGRKVGETLGLASNSFA